MSIHPSDDKLRGFAAGSLSAGDLLDVDDHVSVCQDCRARLARQVDAQDAFEHVTQHLSDPVVHLSDEDVQLLAQGRLPPNRVVEARRHTAECSVCRHEVEQLSAWAGSSRPRRFMTMAAAAAVMIAISSAAVWYLHRNAGDTVITDANSSLAPDARARVNAALQAGAARLPDFMADLTPPREVQMGAREAQPAFSILAPAGTAVIEDRPTFSWQPLPGAAGYVVTVFDEHGAEAQRSPTMSGTRWMPDGPLRRDQTYTWQVKAARDGESLIAPAPPDPPARFRILDPATAAELQGTAREHPEAHLILGILFMEAGVRAPAVSEFTQVRPDDPYAGVARASLERLQASVARPPR